MLILRNQGTENISTMASENRLKNILPSIRYKKIKQRKKPGAAPGTVEHIGERYLDKIQIAVHDYDEEQIQNISIDNIQKVQPFLETSSQTWIKISGLHNIEKLKSIWNFFGLHPLIQEDIVNTFQQPKVDFYDNCLFFVLPMFTYSKGKHRIQTEQISFVLGKNYVISFQETDKTYFKPILDRLSVEGSRIRKLGADYLTYALIDAVVDYYFNIIDNIAEEMENLEDELLKDPDENLLNQIHKIRRETIFFRKSIRPLRDALNAIIRDDSRYISDHTKLYLRDVYDHLIQIIDNIENYRDMVLGLHDMYMSQVSNRMNEVMQVLTIIATIFIPLTFIAGIYGMNFNPETSPYNMPELNWYWGYPASLAVMGIVAIIMIIYFKQKDWF